MVFNSTNATYAAFSSIQCDNNYLLDDSVTTQYNKHETLLGILGSTEMYLLIFVLSEVEIFLHNFLLLNAL